MQSVIFVNDIEVKLEINLKTFHHYEGQFKENLLKALDKIEELRNSTEYEDVLKMYSEMSKVCWALAATADKEQRLDFWETLTPALIAECYNEAHTLIIKSFQISRKNA